MFSVGQKVVYVDGSCTNRSRSYEKLPTVGCVYTVRSIVPRGIYGFDDDGLLLAEIRNPLAWYPTGAGPRVFCELHFRARRFRPLRTTNIDVFTKMLEPAPARERELV